MIAYSGPHGTGKTAAVHDAAGHAQRTDSGSVWVIQELARECPFPILGDGMRPTREGQIWIFTSQIKAELEAAQRYDVVICDRSIVDAIAYSSAAGFHGLAAAQLAMARQHVGIYSEVRFRGADDFNFLVADGVRDTDPEMQREVCARMLELYTELGIKLIRERSG